MNLRLGFFLQIIQLFAFSTNSSHSFNFSVFSFWRQITVIFKTMSSMAMCFFKINCRWAVTESSGILDYCYHSQMRRIPAIHYFTNMIDVFSRLKFFMKYHRELMSAYLFSVVTGISITSLYFGTFPKPASARNLGFCFQLIQIKNIISWRLKNTFHFSPSIVF